MITRQFSLALSLIVVLGSAPAALAGQKPATVAAMPTTQEPPPAPAPTQGLGPAAGVAASTRDSIGAKTKAACDACRAQEPQCNSQSYICSNEAMETCPAADASDGDCENPASSCYLSYFARHGIADPKKALKKLVDACPTNAPDLERVAGLAKERVGEELLLSVVGGLQGFLEDRAKAEALNYTLDQLKGRLCTDKFSKYLVQTCKLLGASDLNLDEATLVRLKQALLADLDQLPATLVAQLPPPKDPDQQALRCFGQSGAEAALDMSQGKIGLSQIPATWADKDRAAYKDAKMSLNCSMLDLSNPMTSGCWVLLLPELGRAAVALKPAPTPAGVAAVVEAAAQGFCSAYGAPKQTEGGSCLLGASTPSPLEKLNSSESVSIKALVLASLRFVQLAKQADSLANQGTPLSEVVKRFLPDIATAFDGWNGALQQLLPTLSKVEKNTLDVTAFVLHASGAVASRDYPTLLAAVAEAFEPGKLLESVKLPPAVMESLGFAARLAAAQKPEDAKKVFEEEAAPLGSYKIKYDREKDTIAINAFVGPFLGKGWQYNTGDATHSGLVARPLSAPIGVDFTLASWKYAHLGLMVTAIDPFAVGTVDSDAKAEDFDWGALLTPGAVVRVGIGGSPFTVLGGIIGQPLARAKDTCVQNGSSVPCWKGAFQVGGAIAVDVPLLILR